MRLREETDAEYRKRRLFEGPQADTSLRGQKWGLSYRNHRRQHLHPDDFSPLPVLAGKHLRAISPALLLWCDAQPWAERWEMWQPVREYLTRHPVEGTPPVEVPIFVDALTVWPGARGIFKDGSCHLHKLPGFEDYLHAFALGAVGMRFNWFQNHAGKVPHYDLTAARQQVAIQCGAVLIDRQQMGQHIARWREAWGMVEVPPTAGPEFVREMPDGSTQCTKHCYGSKKEADTALNHRLTGRQPRRNTRPDYLRSYECGKCGFWHLTSKPDQYAPDTSDL